MEKIIWEESAKNDAKRKEILEDNVRKIRSVIWGQCSPALQAK